jgi:hypothetical protein
MSDPQFHGAWAHDRQIPVVSVPHYEHLEQFDHAAQVVLVDHMTGFDSSLSNLVMHTLNQRHSNLQVWTEQVIDPRVQDHYPNLRFRFDADLMDQSYLRDGYQYLDLLDQQCAPKTFQHLVTCDNRAGHVGRQLLTAGLHKMGLWNQDYCTKGFVTTRDQIDGNIQHYCGSGEQERFLRKFFIDDSELAESDFYGAHLMGYEPRMDQRVANLLNKVPSYRNTFVTVVSETMPESYHGHVTEKFLYAVLTRSLWLGCAQPGWHAKIEQTLGFRRFTKIFDYGFDSMLDPVMRIKTLVCQLATFKSLTKSELHDLYDLESDIIDFNHDHYASGDYLRCLRKFDQ